jgi:hypothetical protein
MLTSGLETEVTAVGIRHDDHVAPSVGEVSAIFADRGCLADHPLSAKVGTNLADNRRLFGRYSSLADSGHGVFLC